MSEKDTLDQLPVHSDEEATPDVPTAPEQVPMSSTCLEGEEQTEEITPLDEPSDAGSNRFMAANVAFGEVFLQAGHFNTPDGRTGASGPLGNEIDWTPIVTGEATRILRAAGVSVIQEDASIKRADKRDKRYQVKVAVFIHFDGSEPAGRAGASIGYDDSTDQPAASAWRALYSKYWPFRWKDDNYTSDLRGYYGYRYTLTQDAELLLELGDLTSLEQAQWLKPRLKWLGALVAHFVSQRIGNGDVPDPGSFPPE